MFGKLSSKLLAFWEMSNWCLISPSQCVDSIICSFFDNCFVFCLQRWQKSGTHLEHLVSRFCLDSEMALDGMDSSRMLVISPCELSAYTQRWEVPFSWPLTLWPFTSKNLPCHPFTASKTWAETATLTERRCMSTSGQGAALRAAEWEVHQDFLTPLRFFITRRKCGSVSSEILICC